MKIANIARIAGLVSAIAAASGCTESLYTTRSSLAAQASDEHLMMAYFTRVQTHIWVYVPKVDTSKGAAQTVTITAVNTPFDKQYLFFKSNDWFNSSAEFGTDLSGLPSKSDSSSTQQVTAILAEAAQTAEGANLWDFTMKSQKAAEVSPQTCVKALEDRAPFAKEFADLRTSTEFFSTDDITWTAQLLSSDPPNSGDMVSPIARNGFYAYEPSTVRVTLVCTRKADGQFVLALPAQILGAYFVRRAVVPQRDFWTNAQDTYTLSDGVLVGHKYSEQSVAKTAVDLITSPIRAALPSVTTQTTTQVQTGGGKPDQTTKTIQVSAAPPKSP